MIDAGAQMPWVAQISANLLQDAELVNLIAESGGRRQRGQSGGAGLPRGHGRLGAVAVTGAATLFWC
jgi:hypothetical protein